MSEPELLGPLSEAAREALVEALAAQDEGRPLDVAALGARFPELAGRAGALGVLLGAARLGLGELTVERSGAGAARGAAPPAAERYRIEAELGRGGMGVVFAAEDRHLRRRLALKRLRESFPGAADGRRVARFLAEARRTAQLAHPGVVPLHDLGLDERGRPYFTMPVVEGATLEELIERARSGADGWSLTRAAMVLLRVAETMAFAHARGVLHRDLKPANVMVGSFGEVYVLDWGLARARAEPGSDAAHDAADGGAPAASDDAGDDARLTRAGDVVGTPAFLAPELAGGGLDAASPASDVYALGAVLYQVLAGVPPYDEARRRGGARAVLTSLAVGPPRALDELQPRPPAELVAVCEKAMARDARARYSGMEALAQDLRAWLEGRVVRAYETGGWAELKKWVRRNRRFSVAAAAAVLALVLGLGAAAYVQSVGRARVERLADRQLLDELAEEAELLWPADEAHAAALGDWVARARELVRRRARHEATLRELDAEAAAAAERADDAGGDAGAAGGWSFADPERRWLHVKLRELVAGLADFAAADPPGLLARVEQRLDAARTLRARSIEAHAGAWAAARSASRPIELAPQLGLVPLGPDPRSGLEEFAHLPSGAAPVRGAAGDLVLAPECGIVLVLLPGGRFDMGARAPATPGEIGSPNVDPLAFEGEGPVRGVELAPFFLAKHELTRAQWRRVAGGDPSFDAEAGGSDQRPVDSVSWEQAALMLGRLGLELPSEAQWEYAARAGTSTPWPWGGDSAPLAASGEVYLPASRPIGELAPNAWGIAGLLGNVSEWCSDRYRDDRAHRGAWFSLGSSGENDELVAQIARASMRMHAGPGELRPIIGMRAARRVDP